MGESIYSLAHHGDVVSSFSGQWVEKDFYFCLRRNRILTHTVHNIPEQIYEQSRFLWTMLYLCLPQATFLPHQLKLGFRVTNHSEFMFNSRSFPEINQVTSSAFTFQHTHSTVKTAKSKLRELFFILSDLYTRQPNVSFAEHDWIATTSASSRSDCGRPTVSVHACAAVLPGNHVVVQKVHHESAAKVSYLDRIK